MSAWTLMTPKRVIIRQVNKFIQSMRVPGTAIVSPLSVLGTSTPPKGTSQ